MCAVGAVPADVESQVWFGCGCGCLNKPFGEYCDRATAQGMLFIKAMTGGDGYDVPSDLMPTFLLSMDSDEPGKWVERCATAADMFSHGMTTTALPREQFTAQGKKHGGTSGVESVSSFSCSLHCRLRRSCFSLKACYRPRKSAWRRRILQA